MRAAAERRRIIAVAEKLRVRRIAQVVDGEAAVAPGGIADIAGADEVMQRRALAERSRLFLAAGAMHAGQPPAAGERRLCGVRHVDHRQHVVDEALEMHRDIGVAPADPPDAMGAEPGRIEKADLARRCRLRDVEHAHAGAERLLGLHGIRQRLGVVVGLAGILLHRPDIRAVDREQNVAVDLQMMRARVLRRGNEGDGLGVERIAHVHDRKAVAEHMADEGMALVHDDLHAVRPSALVAARQETDVLGAGAGQGSGHAGRLSNCRAELAGPGPAARRTGPRSFRMPISPSAGRSRRGPSAWLPGQAG